MFFVCFVVVVVVVVVVVENVHLGRLRTTESSVRSSGGIDLREVGDSIGRRPGYVRVR